MTDTDTSLASAVSSMTVADGDKPRLTQMEMSFVDDLWLRIIQGRRDRVIITVSETRPLAWRLYEEICRRGKSGLCGFKHWRDFTAESSNLTLMILLEWGYELQCKANILFSWPDDDFVNNRKIDPGYDKRAFIGPNLGKVVEFAFRKE